MATSVPFIPANLDEYFEPDAHAQITEGGRLSRNSFERLRSGVAMKVADLLVGSPFRGQQEYDTIYIDSRHKPIHHPTPTAIPAETYRASLGNNAAAGSAAAGAKRSLAAAGRRPR